ncbi:MAG TPA: hypothetical protein ENJ65_06745, partial [Candidatus Tenderia electrophaga]|nr:hypothetical protein [Candidatus Tenderia electrophaga]
MTIQLIDSHCHLDRLDLNAVGGDMDHVIAQAKELGVKQMLCVAINLEHWPEMMEIVDAHDNIFASVGVHPNEDEGEDPTVERLV